MLSTASDCHLVSTCNGWARGRGSVKGKVLSWPFSEATVKCDMVSEYMGQCSSIVLKERIATFVV